MDNPSPRDILAYIDADPGTRRGMPCHEQLRRSPLLQMRFDGLQHIAETQRALERRGDAPQHGESAWHPVRVAPPVNLGSLRLHKLLERAPHRVTFEAHDQTLKQTVSATFLLYADARTLGRLRDTALLFDLDLPGISRLHYLDVVEGFPLIVSDLCPGLPLTQLPPDARPPELVQAVGTLLRRLQEHGLQHGNLDNDVIRVDAGGNVRLCEAALPPGPESETDLHALQRLAGEAPSPGDLTDWLAAQRARHNLPETDSTCVPALKEQIAQAIPNERPIPRAAKVRERDVPELLQLLVRRHGWGGKPEMARDPEWLLRVYPELQRFPESQRPDVVSDLLENDQTAEAAASGAALLTPVLLLPVLYPLRTMLPTWLWIAAIVGGMLLGAWLLAGLVRVGYALLTQRTLRIKLRRRLLAEGVPICARCGYDLQGQTGAICSECGYLAPLIQFRVQLRGQDERGTYDLTAFMNSLTPATAGSLAYSALRQEGYQVLDILHVRQEPGWDADWPVGLLRVSEKEYVA